MRIAMIGLGKMGLNMTRRLIKGGHQVVGCDRDGKAVTAAVRFGASRARTIKEAVAKLKAPRSVWLMIPAGEPVRAAVRELSALLDKGDIVVDGGNSLYKDDAEHVRVLGRQGIHYLDAGVSGGIWGLKEGYCLMIGGERRAFRTLEPVFKTLAPKNGYAHVGPAGTGHFVKMIHNGIEYALMQAYAEGFELLRSHPAKMDLRRIAGLWNRGSVVRSWLLELIESALQKDPELKSVAGYVPDSGEGRWTVQEAVEAAVPVPTIALALFRRFRSRQKDAFSDKLLSALRGEFGGHAVRRKGRT
ncbi:MAG: phosphogluconate dehydrogenase (NAD(+)-dependent, decarboxylating) [Elusimicrobiota bacterium]